MPSGRGCHGIGLEQLPESALGPVVIYELGQILFLRLRARGTKKAARKDGQGHEQYERYSAHRR